MFLGLLAWNPHIDPNVKAETKLKLHYTIFILALNEMTMI